VTDERYLGFAAPELSGEEVARLTELARQARRDILTMTTLARSGHPGGSMSSIEMYLTVWSYANVAPPGETSGPVSPGQVPDPGRAVPGDPGRDRVVVSHGHTSPGVYSALGRLGFIDIDRAVAHFRQAGSPYEGHIERDVRGVEWSTGNLGQGLSAACGMALAGRLTGRIFHTFCLMSDGEQTKGQVAEARRFAMKYGLCDLTVLVDYNDAQISGHVRDIMPEDIPAHWRAAGWKVIEIDGHDIAAIYAALHEAVHHPTAPVAIVARTVIGKGVPFIEDDPEYHGKALTEEQYAEAMPLLGLEPRLEEARSRRAAFDSVTAPRVQPGHVAAHVEVGEPRTYEADAFTDNRSAWGAALLDIAKANLAVVSPAATLGTGTAGQIAAPALPIEGHTPIAVFDCDLAGSVKTDAFWNAFPGNFFESGVQEHTTAAMAGALSTQGVLTFWSDFGVFGIDETYNQNRLTDINSGNLKLALTHCGIDVGEDGKTHQCIDYVGTLRNCFGWRVVAPCDPNQTDRAVRWMAAQPGNVALCVGRSKVPVVTATDGAPAFGGDWAFRYGLGTVLREGDQVAIIAMGSMTHRAVRVHEILASSGVACRVIDMPCPQALDEELMDEAARLRLVVTYEDHHLDTGLGSSVALWLADARPPRMPMLLRFGATHYESSGGSDALYARQGLDPESVADRIVGTKRAFS
jgi:transketolase